MIFSSAFFVFAFLPAVLAVYYLQKVCFKNRFRNIVLLLFSYAFYMYGAGAIVLALAVSTLVDYTLALLIERFATRKRLWITISIVANLGLLGYFKYANFFVYEVNKVLSLLGDGEIRWTSVALPIGISFFTFQKLSYVIDVYRGERRALRSFVDLALYVAMFSQLIAGPIVRFNEISEQLRGRLETWPGFQDGVIRFCWGFAKKVIVANASGEIADVVFGLPVGEMSTGLAWLGVLAYSVQIYFDFSAYSDMAIGLGLMFGFRFPENFNRPYSAVSITDFWRRWHMTLSRWFRDYLYIPLGGSRHGSARTYLNLVVVFALCGLWHGASGIFVIWGLYHGIFLVLERTLGLRRLPEGRMLLLRRAATLLIVMLGWVLFRADSLGHAFSYFHTLFLPEALPIPAGARHALNMRNFMFLGLGATVFLFPRDWVTGRFLVTSSGSRATLARFAVVLLLVPYSMALLASGSYNPFIYFRF